MRVIHARLSPLPVFFFYLFIFCKHMVVFFQFWPVYAYFFIAFLKNEKFQQANSTVTRVCYK